MSSKIHKLIQWVEDPKHPSLGIVLPILKYTGLWHPNLKSLKSCLKLILIYIIVAFFISQYVKCIFFSIGSFKLILQYIPFHLGLVKACFFHKDYKLWEELVGYIRSTECKQSIQKDEEQNKIIKAYIRWSRSVTYFYIILGMATDTILFAEPYQHNKVAENSTVYLYIFDGYTPFRREPPGYYYSMAIQTVFAYMISMYIIAWDMTTVTILIFFVGQLRLCSLYCSRVIEANVATSQKNIAECHEFHTTLVLYQKKFNALISPLMFLYVISISVNLGVCIKEIAELENDLPNLMSSCFYIVALLIQLLLFYWHGNEVTVESERVSYSTFKSDWVDADVRLQRQVALLALTTDKRLSFTAGPFNEMSLETFITILRRSYSFFTLLKRTH